MRGTWTPKNTANGWSPRVSPDGQHVLYGFWETHVTNLDTLVEHRIDVGVRLNPMGWLDARNFLACDETPGNVWRVSVDDFVPVIIATPGPSNYATAGNGHWAIYKQDSAQPQDYCIKDGAPFHPELRQFACVSDGAQLVTADKSANYELLHFTDDSLVRRLPSANRWTVNAQGDITTGYYGVVDCYPQYSGKIDATVTPWKLEEPGCLVRVDAQGTSTIARDLWLWNGGDAHPSDDTKTCVMGRRVGERDPIVLPNFRAVWVHAVFVDNVFIVAGNDELGHLQVRYASPDAPRVNLAAAAIGNYGHKVFCAPFKAWNVRDDYGKTDIPSNATTLDTPFIDEVPGDKHFLGDCMPDPGMPDTEATKWTDRAPVVPDARFIGHAVFLEGAGTNEPILREFRRRLPLVKAESIRRKRPLVFCVDGAPWPESEPLWGPMTQPEPGLEYIPMLELYPYEGLTRQQIVAEWRRNILFALTKWKRLWFATSLYTQSGHFPVALIEALQPEIANLIREFKPYGFSPFSVGRPSGVLTNAARFMPILLSHVHACTQGVPALGVAMPSTGTITIAPDYTKQVATNQSAHARAVVTGDVAAIQWRLRALGTTPWNIAATNPRTQLAYDYTFRDAGQYEISAVAVDAAGFVLDTTGSQRLITVVAAHDGPKANLLTQIDALRRYVEETL